MVNKAGRMLDAASVIVFDFDGTLVDSNPIKLKAFEICFADQLEKRSEILSYCFKHHHVPRWEKFRTVYQKILRKPYTKAIEKRLLKRYEAATTQGVVDAPEIAGAEAFLKRNRKAAKTAVLSSTPHNSLLKILKKRRWMGYFNVVQGAPVNKGEWLKSFMKENRLPKKDVVFLGDNAEDARSAKVAGCRFVGVANPALKNRGDAFILDFSKV